MMKMWISGLYEFFLRYKNIWMEVWKIRKELDHPNRKKDENEFLPAHLELIETPVSKKPRLIAYLIMLFLALAILLASIGKVEIVATAPGKLAFSGRSKEIKPIENAIVENIFVQDGQFVEKGELLVDLNALGTDADIQKTMASLALAKLENYRYQTLLTAIEKEALPLIDLSTAQLKDTSEEDRLRVKHLIEEQYTTWQKQKSQKILAYKRKDAEKQTASAYVRKYEGITRIEQEKLKDFKILYHKKSLSKHELLSQENKAIEAQNELAVYRSKLNELEHDLLQAKEDLELITQLFKSDVLEKLKQHSENERQLKFELEKNNQRKQASMIKAPASGTVQQLKIHTIGGVVTTAETLMVIVPEDDVLEAIVQVQNKDIGFVDEGQDVIIKVETFPYTRYGYLTGQVKHISPDAIEHPNLGLVFNATISIDKKNLISPDGKQIELNSGMAITAEIKTGMRSVMSYLLSPLEESISEGLRER